MIKAGEKLKEARLEKGLSLDDVAKNTKIKTSFLALIEEGEYSKLPSVSYTQGFVRNYAKFLGLPEKEIMAVFRREFDEEKAYEVLPSGFDNPKEFPVSRFKIRQTAVLVLFIFIVFIGYILFQYRYAFINPPLDIRYPKDMATITSSEIVVTGRTDSNSTVYVNKELVSVDGSGNFHKSIDVFPGKVIITVKVINKFSKETEKKVEVNVKPGS